MRVLLFKYMIFIRRSLATLTTYCTEQKIEVGIDIRTGTNINSTQRGVCVYSRDKSRRPCF